VVRFKGLSFGHSTNELLDKVDFSIDKGSKVTIMGQNGSGKSTIIKLLSKILCPDEGQVHVGPGETVACAMQTMPTECRDLTVKAFFAAQLDQVNVVKLENHELEAKMAGALNDVLLEAPGDRIIKSFSGGQQARLLLAAALIQNPTILLLDEPTNNLDLDGLWHLQNLIQYTDKTCVVISHDEDFLNSFTDQVLYLDIWSKKVETYVGDYFFVKSEISKRIQRENAKNAQLEKKAQAKKDQANKFANKGGGMRKVAKTMRGVAAEMEANLVDVRKEDQTLKDFTVPFSPASPSGKLLRIEQVSAFQRAEPIQSGPVELRRGSRVQVCGPNGIGKTTFLERIVAGTAPGVTIAEGAEIGYYRQDFHNFDFDATVLSCLEKASNSNMSRVDMGETRRMAAAFLLRGNNVMRQQVKTLSEGQKGLLSLACLCLQQPSILIMDEPTNHINFRHLPALAKAVRNFQGAVLIVSHDSHFIEAVGVDSTIDMGEVLNVD
jgi:ATPase subunit of ABC transporter with duplicated ATPase domains